MASASSGVAGLGEAREREERKRSTEGVEAVVGIVGEAKREARNVGDGEGSDRRSSKGWEGKGGIGRFWLLLVFGSDPKSAGSVYFSLWGLGGGGGGGHEHARRFVCLPA